jgi:uncharacterized protein
MYPTDDEIVALHKKHAPNDDAFELIFTHSQIVSEIALSLLNANPSLTIDRELIHAAALLHDIGAYEFYQNGTFDQTKYIRHGVEGHRIIGEAGYPALLQGIASHHTGVGIGREEIIARNLPLPVDDYFARTIEERLIMYADKFHTKTPQFNRFETYVQFTIQFNPTNEIMFRALADEFGVPNLERLAEKYGHPLI